MARFNGPIPVYSRNDTTPTDAEGGYAGGDATAAAVGTSLAQSGQAVATVDNLSATATALPPGASPTVTVSGPVPNKVINIGVPRGEPGMGYEEGQQLLADSQAVVNDSNAILGDYGDLVTRAENAEAAALEVPDANVSALIGNPATETRTALDGAYSRTDSPASHPTLGIGVTPPTAYAVHVQNQAGGGKWGMRIDQLDSTSTARALSITNAAKSFALNIEQTGAGGVNDAVNVVAAFGGAHTPVGVRGSNTSLSTVKVTNDAPQTSGMVIAALGTDPARTAGLIGGENHGSGPTLSAMQRPGSTASGLQVSYDTSGGAQYSSRAVQVLGQHTGGNVVHIENSGAQTTNALMVLWQRNAASTSPALQIINSGTGDQILGQGNNFRVDNQGGIRSRRSTEPPDSALVTGEFALWFDTTTGAAQLNVKAKQANGVVVRGSIPLNP